MKKIVNGNKYKSKRRWDFHIDHIKPISKGGLSEPDNLQLLERYLNMLMGNKDKDEYMEKTGLKGVITPNADSHPFEKIEMLMRSGNLEEAIELCSEKIEIDPEDGELYGFLGDIYFIKGDYDNAYKNYEIGSV
ncbi:HNH endonuclease [Peptoclostridium litorale]